MYGFESPNINLISGFIVGNGDHKISLLQYVYDILVFLDGGLAMAKNSKAVVLCLEIFFGMHVNNHKLKLFDINEVLDCNKF